MATQTSENKTKIEPLIGTKKLSLGKGEQTATYNHQADLSIASIRYKSGRIGKFLHLSFKDTKMIPGKFAHDENSARGYFLEKIVVQAWFQRGTQYKPDNNKVSKDIFVHQTAPAGASNESGSISSSLNFSLSASAGTFGDQATASISPSISIGHSFSHPIKDFTFMDHTEGGLLNHEYLMTQSGEGRPYHMKNRKNSLLPDHSPFYGARINSIPFLAKSNFPISSQGIWMVNLDKPEILKETVMLVTKIKTSFVKVSATGYGVYTDWDEDVVTHENNNGFLLDLKNNKLLKSINF